MARDLLRNQGISAKVNDEAHMLGSTKIFFLNKETIMINLHNLYVELGSVTKLTLDSYGLRLEVIQPSPGMPRRPKS